MKLKLKLLALLLTMGFVAFGGDVKAGKLTTAKEAEYSKLSKEQLQAKIKLSENELLTMTCGLVKPLFSLIGSKECEKACTNVTSFDPAAFASCMASLAKIASDVPEVGAAVLVIEGACFPTCNTLFCHSPWGGADLQKVCTAVCCPLKPSTVEGTCITTCPVMATTKK